MTQQAQTQGLPVIVVGVDGSPTSIAALRWAARHARRSGEALEVVTGWEVPATIMITPRYTESDYQAEAQNTLDQSLRWALGPEPDLPVESSLVQEPPGRALVAASEGAEMVVVGDVGLGGVLGAHQGSVASYVLRHARCPVVVVRQEG